MENGRRKFGKSLCYHKYISFVVTYIDNFCSRNYINYSTLNDDVASHYIYRIIGLWFANKSDTKLHETIIESIENIPSYKFLCVINQLTAQLNSKYLGFVAVIKNILIRCTEEHHHISLYQLLPIIFDENGKKTINNNKEQRIKIAKEILSQVSKNKKIQKTMMEMESMFSALISFANLNTKAVMLNSVMKLVKGLSSTHVPTLVLPVSRSCHYNIISVEKWKDEVSFCGGINAPKKLACICSDGIVRQQLLKGTDDLRQDAVMQQVFGVVNDLLRSDPSTSQNKMVIRTYKIVPLSKVKLILYKCYMYLILNFQRTGILEWCDNTITFGGYLKEAYKKYDSSFSLDDCRRRVSVISKDDITKRLEMYRNICEMVQPIFHYFFFEKFLIPGIWFERRLAYTNR